MIGLILAAIGFFMYRSGTSHRDSYRDFERCKASSAAVCVLYNDGSQARSASEFKKNYENQLRLGLGGLALGGVLAIAGIVRLIAVRRESGPTLPEGAGQLT